MNILRGKQVDKFLFQIEKKRSERRDWNPRMETRTYAHCKMSGHGNEKCWNLHLGL